MSWSFGPAEGTIHQVREDFKTANKANPVFEPENTLRERCVDMVTKMENAFGLNGTIALSASGSQSMVDGKAVSAVVNLSLSAAKAEPEA